MVKQGQQRLDSCVIEISSRLCIEPFGGTRCPIIHRLNLQAHIELNKCLLSLRPKNEANESYERDEPPMKMFTNADVSQ